MVLKHVFTVFYTHGNGFYVTFQRDLPIEFTNYLILTEYADVGLPTADC